MIKTQEVAINFQNGSDHRKLLSFSNNKNMGKTMKKIFSGCEQLTKSTNKTKNHVSKRANEP